MPGTITFRPIEANLTHNTDLIGKMNPYCAFIVGDSIFRGQVCKKGGKHPHWDDSVTIPYTNQSQVIVEVMDKDRFSRDDNIGSFMINLNAMQTTGGSKWYPLTYKNKPAGEILLETSFSGVQGFNQGMNQGYTNQTGFEQSTLNQGFIEGQSVNRTGYERDVIVEQPIIEKEIIVEQPVVVEKEIFTEQAPIHHDRKIFTEQQQVVEPRTFLKEVDVVETRSVLQNIEVMEPTKVLRDVQYTQAVPVMKQIEVVEPHVVVKEVEVIEPRLVTKTIQVVENVAVKKQVEVIESVSRMQEVQTFEPQTFTKQVEVTDYVPVQKQVTVSEPVHLKKQVEFVEPVITTKTITKELLEPVIVDTSITTTVGPASVIHESISYIERFNQLNITELERKERITEWERLRATGISDYEIERQFETRGWGFGKHSHHHHHQQSGLSFMDRLKGLNLHEKDRLERTNEYTRLRGTGLSDYDIEREFETRGWGFGNQSGYTTQSGYTNQSGFNTQSGLHGPHTTSQPLQKKY